MTQLEAMYASVKESPRESTLRLAYADCLDEHDQHVDAAMQRILACPEDDGFRLAMADALDAEATRMATGRFLVLPESDIGQRVAMARKTAEFIRVQVALAKCTVKRRPIRPDHRYPAGRDWGRYNDQDKEFREFEALSLRERELEGYVARPLVCLHSNKTTFTPMDYNDYRVETVNESISRPSWRMRVSTHRGFVDSATMDAAEWWRHGDELLEVYPITKVTARYPAAHDFSRWRERWPNIKFTF